MIKDVIYKYLDFIDIIDGNGVNLNKVDLNVTGRFNEVIDAFNETVIYKIFGASDISLTDWMEERGIVEPYRVIYGDFEMWFKDGELHRDDDEPAYIGYHENGVVSCNTWYRDGKIYRDNDKPVIIHYNKKGKVKRRYWLSDNTFTGIMPNNT